MKGEELYSLMGGGGCDCKGGLSLGGGVIWRDRDVKRVSDVKGGTMM